jgi:hypothetical protein
VPGYTAYGIECLTYRPHAIVQYYPGRVGPGPVGRVQPLRHDAFEPHLAGPRRSLVGVLA